ncbi:MAG: ATP-binding protein [Polyangiaceae bacterium]
MALLGTLGFITAIVFFVVASIRFAATTKATDHTSEAKLAIAELRLNILRADKGTEDYAITGAPDRKALFEKASADFRGDVATVRLLLASDPQQVDRIDFIDAHITPRFTVFRAVIDIRDRDGRDAAITAFDNYLNTRGIEIRNSVNDILTQEDLVLAQQRNAGHQASIASIIAASLASVFFAFLVVFAWSARRAQEQEKATLAAQRAQLEAENEKLTERAQVTIFQERFMAVLGHDLRNPLGAISMGIDLLKREVSGEDKTLQRMASSSQRMARMIDQLLDLTRSRLGGGIELTPTPMDLGKVTNEIVDELRVQRADAPLHVDSKGNLRGTWDSDRLAQVISNLVGNALHHGAADKKIDIVLDGTGPRVSFSIRNDGKTIPESLRSVLFDPFRRGDRQGNSSKTAGLGLGLFITKEIVTKHGGSIAVSSSEESGTAFTFELPRETQPRAILDDVPKAEDN